MSTENRFRLGTLAAVIVVCTFVSYLPAMRGGFIWDDDDYVTNNDMLRSVDGLRRIWIPGETTQYYPFVYTTFWAEYQVWQLHPTGYHVVNVLLHTMGSLLLWVVLRRLTVHGAWLAALIFALHPVHVESVAWITERKNVLSGVLVFLSLLAYLRFEPCITTGSKSGRRSWRHYGFSQALFVCALLAKTVVCTFPAVIGLVLWWKRRLSVRTTLPLLPMFAVGAVAAKLTADMELSVVGARGAEWSLSLLERILLAGRILWFYVEKLVWPLNVNLIYYRWDIDAATWWQYLFPITAIGILGAMWLLRERIGRPPLVAALFFAGTLAPALGFFNVYFMRYSYVADHFQYLASIGPIAGIAFLLTRLVGGRSVASEVDGRGTAPAPRRSKSSVEHVHPGRPLVGCLMVGLAILTWKQGQAYKNVETLWRDTLRKNDSAWIAHGNLGNILMGQGKFDEAEMHLTRALQLKKDFAEAHLGMGMVLAERGRFDEAIEQFRERLRLKHASPMALSNLGTALASTGQTTEAAERFAGALLLDPNHGDAHLGLGLLLARQGRFDEAGRHFRSALRSDPRNVDAQYGLGLLLARQGRLDEAARAFRETLRIAPNHSEARRALQSLPSNPPSGSLP